MKATHELPDELPPDRRFTQILDGNLIAFCDLPDDSLTFLRLPPVTGQRSVERWSTPPFPFSVKAFAAYTPDNILAIAEDGRR